MNKRIKKKKIKQYHKNFALEKHIDFRSKKAFKRWLTFMTNSCI